MDFSGIPVGCGRKKVVTEYTGMATPVGFWREIMMQLLHLKILLVNGKLRLHCKRNHGMFTQIQRYFLHWEIN